MPSRASSSAVRGELISHESSLAALKHPAFRLYFAGQLISVSGTWMQSVAQQIVVYNLTNSELALGVVACVQGLPTLFLMPFAGVIVERYDRRKLLVFTQTAMMILAFILAALQFANVLQVWHIVVLSFSFGVANALDAPARQAFVIEMVGKEHLSSGIVLNSIMFNTARIVGPALGAFALKAFGPAWCFFLNGASFLAVIASLIVMVVPPVQPFRGRFLFLEPFKEGFQLARSHPAIWPILMLSTVTSLFGLTFTVLIPAFADQILHDKEIGTGALLTAVGIGAVLAATIVARMNNSGRRGQMLVIGSLATPIMVILTALTRSYASSLAAAGLAGFFLISQFILMNTLIQIQVPDEFRGRVLSLYALTFFGLSPFSSLAIGLIAQETSTVTALLLYGVAGLVGMALIVWRSPQLWRLH
jgi:MFS family permease